MVAFGIGGLVVGFRGKASNREMTVEGGSSYANFGKLETVGKVDLKSVTEIVGSEMRVFNKMVWYFFGK